MEDLRYKNFRVRRSILREFGYVAEGHHKSIWRFERKAKIHLLWKVAPSSLFKAITPEFPWFHQLPWINTNSLSLDAFLVVSPTLIKASVLFQEILNSNSKEGLPDGCPPVLTFIEDREVKPKTQLLMAERKLHLNKLDVLPSSAQDSSQYHEACLSLLKVKLVPQESLRFQKMKEWK